MSKTKILVIESDSFIGKKLAEQYNNDSSECRIVSTIEEGYKIAREKEIDIIIANNNTNSKMSGIQLTKKLKSNPKTSSISIFLISNKDIEQKALKAGVDNFTLYPYPLS